MNAKQKREVIALLKKDCAIEGDYINGLGETCAIGCLALACGVPERSLMRGNLGFEESEKMMRKIIRRFGIDRNDIGQIMRGNDGCHDSVTARRRAVLKVVRAIKV